MAIKEVKEHMKNEENEGPMSRNDVTPTPQQNLEVEMKIQLTQMKAAYQQVSPFTQVIYLFIVGTLLKLGIPCLVIDMKE